MSARFLLSFLPFGEDDGVCVCPCPVMDWGPGQMENPKKCQYLSS